MFNACDLFVSMFFDMGEEATIICRWRWVNDECKSNNETRSITTFATKDQIGTVIYGIPLSINCVSNIGIK